jgi:hypothetical protein
MKILFDNILTDSIITSNSGSLNYPESNLYHRFLKKRWQSLIKSSIITIVFNSPKTINSIVFDYYNLSLLNYSILDTNDNILYSNNENNFNQTIMHYFNTINNAKKIIVECESNDILMIGNIFAGESIKFRNFSSDYIFGYDEKSNVVSSIDSQYSVQRIDPVKTFEITIPQCTELEKSFIMNLYYNKGIGSPFYIDFFEMNRTIQSPIYAVFSNIPTIQKNGRMFDISMKFKEAK